ncbi:MAG: hypothetical protein ACK4YV_07960, partial [Emticicia sp.]
MVILKGRVVIRLDKPKHYHNKILFLFIPISILLTNQNQILFCFNAKYSTDRILLLKKDVPITLTSYHSHTKYSSSTLIKT